MRTVINVISGKGGTGKTLLTAVLAEMLGNMGRRVLVVDLDIFVRGLTALLYFQKGEMLKLVGDDEISVSDYFKADRDAPPALRQAISKYRSFDVFPSVGKVNETLRFNIMPSSFDEANQVVSNMLNSISREYDYIFLDSRAGYDELIAATHKNSNISLCVEEDDNISMVTSENLISQLNEESGGTILRIKNKARQMPNGKDGMGLNFIGAIPFDADVMNSFGTPYFWTDIDKSLYKDALIKVWNSLSKKMGLNDEMQEGTRITPVGSKTIEKSLAKLPTFKRIMFMYGTILVLLGVGLYISRIDPDFFLKLINDPLLLVGVIGIFFGILLMLSSILLTGKKKS